MFAYIMSNELHTFTEFFAKMLSRARYSRKYARIPVQINVY
jgi:hypothetical protein